MNISEPQPIALQDLQCPLCSELFLRPVSVPCGHTFCYECILRALDSHPSCPICRHRLHLSPHPLPNLVIQSLVHKVFPESFLERQNEYQEQISSSFWLPVFVLSSLIFPGESLKLHVYEPRYRLMIRRCLQGSREFGVMLFQNPSDPQSLLGHAGVIVTITNETALPDGRFNITLEAKERFRATEIKEMDGYIIARRTAVDVGKTQQTSSSDIPSSPSSPVPSSASSSSLSSPSASPTSDPTSPPPTSVSSPTTSSSHVFSPRAVRPVDSATSELLNQVRGKLRQAGFSSLLFNSGYDRDNVDITEFSYWVASSLQIDMETRQELLDIDDAEERLRRSMKILDNYSLPFCTIL